jgi:hypothetical protein
LIFQCGSSENQGLHFGPLNVPCERQGQLLKLFRALVSSYSIAVNDLNLTRGKTSKQEYGRLLARWEQARKASERARLELELHIKEHDC